MKTKQSFWCWLRRHRMLVGGYKYHFAYDGRIMRVRPVMLCQCKIADVKIPSFVDQLKGKT